MQGEVHWTARAGRSTIDRRAVERGVEAPAEAVDLVGFGQISRVAVLEADAGGCPGDDTRDSTGYGDGSPRLSCLLLSVADAIGGRSRGGGNFRVAGRPSVCG